MTENYYCHVIESELVNTGWSYGWSRYKAY